MVAQPARRGHSRISSFAERRRKELTQQDDQRASSNPNWNWLNYKGTWTTTLIVIAAMRLFFGVMPAISPELAWTLTNLSYNLVHFVMFHWLSGTPFDLNQGAFDGLTLWEQIDDEVQFTPTKKFFTAVPIALFLMSIHYTSYDATTFVVNLVALLVVLAPKLPVMHRVRLFGVNKVVVD
ncbi:sphingolipid homeostasis protein orm1 [Sorochytrium milnesiophthora]